jgi:hypothetical protein
MVVILENEDDGARETRCVCDVIDRSPRWNPMVENPPMNRLVENSAGFETSRGNKVLLRHIGPITMRQFVPELKTK